MGAVVGIHAGQVWLCVDFGRRPHYDMLFIYLSEPVPKL
jgi:hypothetical protein